MERRQIVIFDTTLRDGEQAPGCSLYPEEKVRIARQLENLGVDVIEPGFPASSPGDFEAVQTISRAATRAEICGFARAIFSDIDAAVRATEDAPKRRLHLFISSSQIHLDFQLRKSREEVLRIARECIAYAKQFVDKIEFSPMDASRTDEAFLWEMIETAIEAGATIINVPDTVGYALPEEYGAIFRRIRENVRGIDRVMLSAHCHNDLGLAVANSLAALRNGAEQVEVTVNGVGERTGNCSLEELVMAIDTRGEALQLATAIDPSQIYETCRLVSRTMNFPIAHNKPVVGRNAFQHESGIHQDGLLKHRSTYEIMDPERLGVPRNMIVLGKHSGRHALQHRLAQFGIHLSDPELDDVFRRFKDAADAKKTVSDDDLIRLAAEGTGEMMTSYTLVHMQVMTANDQVRVASVTVRDNRTGVEESHSCTGSGPVEAVIGSLKKAFPFPTEFVDLELHSLSVGETANGEATVTIAMGGETFRGTGVHPDIIVAVAHAYMSACNQAAQEAHSLHAVQEALAARN
ncbi:2-isopropylmalate synthase [Alicyclobacillus contaminans]|uniref:2-isopropylmalate synthase n=1 Tax=Alicyclobacillus contaminans TaxID=392016 RepID=UPI0003FDF01B|nr:2-isopropylmalate synthase [Alicyclobacillus contaminans]GMA49884.1 2-isopropylmalate synthase [Alicyclobacillus contaminans]